MPRVYKDVFNVTRRREKFMRWEKFKGFTFIMFSLLRHHDGKARRRKRNQEISSRFSLSHTLFFNSFQ